MLGGLVSFGGRETRKGTTVRGHKHQSLTNSSLERDGDRVMNMSFHKKDPIRIWQKKCREKNLFIIII